MKYEIIYADPPWTFETYSKPKNNYRFAKSGSIWRNADRHYPCMPLDEIKSLDVQGIAADNCVLFMWATFPLLEDAFDVIKAWGFEYKTCAFVWVKRYENLKWKWGMGYWTRSNAEPCLLATRGRPKRDSAKIHQIVETISKQHSKKPPVVRDEIVRLMGDLPRVELFARQQTEGWDVWGNQVVTNVYLGRKDGEDE